MSAAAEMYQHGRHLAEIQGEPHVDFLETASAQAMSYLAAINSLSLVDSKNAWIEFAVPPSESNQVSRRIFPGSIGSCLNIYVSQKRRKLSHHIPDKHFANAGLDIDVVSLAEMKQEYVLVMSRLEVYREFPAIHSKFSRAIGCFIER
jgi:nuclear pore complex protein Nup160